jgi:hypothetical protein
VTGGIFEVAKKPQEANLALMRLAEHRLAMRERKETKN